MPKAQQNLNVFFGSKRGAAQSLGTSTTNGTDAPIEVINEEVGLRDRESSDDPLILEGAPDPSLVNQPAAPKVAPKKGGPVYSIFDKNAPPPQPQSAVPSRGRKRKADDPAVKAPRKSSKTRAQQTSNQPSGSDESGPPTKSAIVQEKNLARPLLNLLQVPGTSSRPLSRTSSRSSGSAMAEPIVIDDDATPGSQEAPIRVDEYSVVKKGPAPPPHPFFKARTTAPPTARPNGTFHRAKTPVPPPWPGAEDQHVRGEAPEGTMAHMDRVPPFKRRRLNTQVLEQPTRFDYKGLVPDLFALPSESRPTQIDQKTPRQIPSAHLRHPALSRLSEPSEEQQAELWCDKYRPLRAEEVLGNEEQAVYLRDWLKALELSEVQDQSRPAVSGEKRTVIRAVDRSRRRKRKRGEYDWIVSDDDGAELPEDPVEEWTAADDGAVSDNGSAASSAGPQSFLATPRPTRHLPVHDFSQRLTNAILISGPPGCGKTATVYACVEELGWDVFEVYPGIGKRSGSGLMTLVGEVGRNHLVRKAPTTKAAFERLLFAGKTAAGTPEQPISIDSSSPPRMESPDSNGTIRTAAQAPAPEASRFRQSVILLEEVDVLFREDAGFWQAVVALVKDSHRPVIMTCNDPSLVPTEDLALQEHLVLDAADIELQISYLQRITEVEGRSLRSEVLRGIREGPCDLRKAINLLQWACSGDDDIKSVREDLPLSAGFAESGETILAMLQRQSAFLDYRSFGDAYLRRPDSRTVQALEPDYPETTLDEEQGHVVMPKPPPADTDVGIAAYLLDQQFADEVDATAISYFSHLTPLLEGEPAAGSACLLRLLTYLAPLIPISSYLLPHPAVIVDYAPWVREMVHADDKGAEADEAREAARFSRAGRPMRLAAAKWNARLPYARWIALDDLALQEARRRLEP